MCGRLVAQVWILMTEGKQCSSNEKIRDVNELKEWLIDEWAAGETS